MDPAAMDPAATDPTTQAWTHLGGDPALTASVSYDGPRSLLPSRLPVMGLARASVAACALAAAELAARRTGGPGAGVPRVHVDDGAVATAFLSERHLRVDGRPGATFTTLSRFWRADGGWVRTHANYPHHRNRLLTALDLADSGDDTALTAQVAARLAERRPEEIERTVYEAGGLAVAVREHGDWMLHGQGSAVAAHPLLTFVRRGGAAERQATACAPGQPAGGVRVLDLSRVIAGPVATRALAFLGADVLRVDAPQLPESQDAHNDTGFGKRSVRLDLTSPADRETFDELLSAADVVVSGYRPGALDRHHLAPDALVERHPGLIVVRLTAWGEYGPWGGRRGFDSLVQAASGIAGIEGTDGEPGALPAQALDHATGYLMAAAVLRGLTEQHDTGGSRIARFSLAQTAHWLLSGLPPEPAAQAAAYDPAAWLAETPGPLGVIRHARSPLTFEGAPATWASPPGLLGADTPRWR